jgi:hypothetical protein
MAKLTEKSLGTTLSASDLDYKVVDVPGTPASRKFPLAREKTLTSGADVSLCEIALPVLTGASGVLEYTVIAKDATDIQTAVGLFQWAGQNKGGVYVKSLTHLNEQVLLSVGSLVVVFELLDGTNKITIRVNATTSLSPSAFTIVYRITNQSNQVLTFL